MLFSFIRGIHLKQRETPANILCWATRRILSKILWSTKAENASVCLYRSGYYRNKNLGKYLIANLIVSQFTVNQAVLGKHESESRFETCSALVDDIFHTGNAFRSIMSIETYKKFYCKAWIWNYMQITELQIRSTYNEFKIEKKRIILNFSSLQRTRLQQFWSLRAEIARGSIFLFKHQLCRSNSFSGSRRYFWKRIG